VSWNERKTDRRQDSRIDQHTSGTFSRARYEVLTTGSMQAQAAALSDVQKRQIGEFLAARPMGKRELR
jgi:hypothetical protein